MHCSEKSSSLNHLVSGGEKRRWHRDARRLRGLEVDREIELGRLLGGDVGGLVPRTRAANCRDVISP
jgi:hypothetical protein